MPGSINSSLVMRESCDEIIVYFSDSSRSVIDSFLDAFDDIVSSALGDYIAVGDYILLLALLLAMVYELYSCAPDMESESILLSLFSSFFLLYYTSSKSFFLSYGSLSKISSIP